MKLAAIYNVWDGVEHLRGSMECLKNEVDLFVIVWQDVSNFGEKYSPLKEIQDASDDLSMTVLLQKYTPNVAMGGGYNERRKRNIGLDIAKQHNCTHFFHLDCDEYYPNFAEAKRQYISTGAQGSACKIYTYFKEKTLRCETEDGYFVPFIHALRPDTVAGVKHYPFYVDPTRRINETDVALLHTHMHHYSWVRNDIERKVRNSTAKNGIARGKLLEDYYSPEVGEGFYVRDWGKRLVRVEDTTPISVL